jgi:hypothetical protein
MVYKNTHRNFEFKSNLFKLIPFGGNKFIKKRNNGETKK